MRHLRIGRTAAALLCALAAETAAMDEVTPAGDEGAGVAPIRISGEVRRGDRFDWPLPGGLRFVLEPVWGAGGSGPDGWKILVLGADSTQNFVGIATPPYHGPNESVIEGWHFRSPRGSGTADSSRGGGPGGAGASGSGGAGAGGMPQTERGFYFVTKATDYEAYRVALEKVLWPEGLSDADLDSIQTAMEQIPRGEGLLTIRSMALDGLGPGEVPWFERMRFDVTLRFPGGRKDEAPPGAPGE